METERDTVAMLLEGVAENGAVGGDDATDDEDTTGVVDAETVGAEEETAVEVCTEIAEDEIVDTEEEMAVDDGTAEAVELCKLAVVDTCTGHPPSSKYPFKTSA